MIQLDLFSDDPAARRRRTWLGIALLVLMGVLSAMAVSRAIAGKGSRYDENVSFSRELVYESKNVYRIHPAQATHTKYPPFYFVYVAPFVPLPIGVGAFLWFLVNLGMLVATVRMAVSLAWPVDSARSPPLEAHALLAGAVSYVAITNLVASQVNIQIGFFVVLGLWLIRRGREESGGWALMTATMLKLTPALLLIWLLVRRRWLVLRGAAVAFIALWFLIGIVLGGDFAIEATRAWIDVLIPFAREGVLGEGIGGVRGTNQSLAAALFRFFADVPAATGIEGSRVNVVALSFDTVNAIIRLVSVVLLLGVAWVLGRGPVDVRSHRFVREGALLIALTLVVSPITWNNHHIALILPYAVGLQAWREASRARRPTLQRALGVSIGLLLLTSSCPWLQALGLPLLGVVIVGVLLASLVRRSVSIAG
ncbi:MAG: glycosyltransferase family 87 protein [Planctomycetota bacterium]|nr:glycosyltransferase family 87 protein [Planctomycetota bacterium]